MHDMILYIFLYPAPHVPSEWLRGTYTVKLVPNSLRQKDLKVELASLSSDSYIGAYVHICMQIKERMWWELYETRSDEEATCVFVICGWSVHIAISIARPVWDQDGFFFLLQMFGVIYTGDPHEYLILW